MIGIYAIRHIESGRSYIGSSVSIERRTKEHVVDLVKGKHYNPHLQHAWNVYGKDSFEITTIEEVYRESDLTQREQYHVDANNGNVYNAIGPVDCPWRGKKRSVEHTEKLRSIRTGRSQPYTPEQRRKIIESNKRRTGAKHTPESIAKISAALRGHKYPPRSDATRAKMSAIAKIRTYSAETRAKISAASKARKRLPVTHATREKLSAIKKATWHSRRGGPLAHTVPHTEEAKARMSASQKAAWARRKAVA